MKNYKTLKKDISNIYNNSRRVYRDEISRLRYSKNELERYLSKNEYNENDLLKLHKCFNNDMPNFRTHMMALIVSLISSAIYGVVTLMSEYDLNAIVMIGVCLLSIIILYITLVFILTNINKGILGYKNTYYNKIVAKLIEKELNIFDGSF